VRAVLDASLLVAAVWTRNPRSASRVVLDAAAGGAFLPVLTDEIEAQYRDVLSRDKVRRGAPAGAYRAAGGVLEALLLIADRVEAAPDVRVIAKDPKDDKYVAAALGGRAEYVVTLDRHHMLAIAEYRGIRFVAPGDFLAVLRAS
jgi:predicted nucleic acid-binding protein